MKIDTNRKIEELSMNAWAALQTLVYDGWIIRFANGYTKRANSINPIYNPNDDDLENKIKYCETLFQKRKLPTVYKMTNETHPDNLDAVLHSKGYNAIDKTSVQILDLSILMEPLNKSVELNETLNDAWLYQFCILSNNQENFATLKQMLSSIIPKTCFISLYENKVAVACGLGVLDSGYLGIFDIVTDFKKRNRGFGEQLIMNLLKWGKENGAKFSYLQVTLNNAPAVRLYSKLGYKEIYRYWYRVKQ
jgi:ribosomal protein S18 acetylase RimI-like enzyme